MSRKPVVALVGRPNVGKSTLFNRLTKSRDAIVADYPGLTRDRQYGTGKVGRYPYIVVDTGGLSGEEAGVDPLMEQQVIAALEEADVILFLVDGQAGLTPADEQIAAMLRQKFAHKPIYVLVNKAEGRDPDVVKAEFYQLGLGEPLVISAEHGDHVREAIDYVLEIVAPKADEDETPEPDDDSGIRVAVVGRPNVGKSTLINRMIGEERVVAYDMPGTTRDSIRVPFERDGVKYTLIDTAGVRRRKKVSDKIEKFSVIKAIEAMDQAHVVVLVIDGSEGITDQDQTLLGHALESGRGLIIAINKWDNLDPDQRRQVKADLDLKLQFADFAPRHFISALHGTGVGNLFDMIRQVYQAATTRVSTSELNRVLQQALLEHQPPMVSGRRIKMRYAHLGGINPPTVVIHGNMVDRVPQHYTRYLTNVFRKAFGWEGTPVRIEYRVTDNPFEGKRTKLSDRQIRRKRKLMAFVKQKKKALQRKKRGK
jgi:GTP-binding protein